MSKRFKENKSTKIVSAIIVILVVIIAVGIISYYYAKPLESKINANKTIVPLNLVKRVDRRVVVFPSTSPNDLRVTVYDPLRGVLWLN
jgi:hypothetical protein